MKMRTLLSGLLKIRQSETGQNSSELMLVIGVVSLAVVTAAYTFVPLFADGVGDLAEDVSRELSERRIAGVSNTIKAKDQAIDPMAAARAQREAAKFLQESHSVPDKGAYGDGNDTLLLNAEQGDIDIFD